MEEKLLFGGFAAAMLALLLWRRIARWREQKRRDFTRTLDTLLLPGERISVQCETGGGHIMLSNKRLLIQKKGNYAALPFKKIKRLRGVDAAGKTTSAPSKITRLTVQAEREYVLESKDPEFPKLISGLKEKIKKNFKPIGQKKPSAAKKSAGKKKPGKTARIRKT